MKCLQSMSIGLTLENYIVFMTFYDNKKRYNRSRNIENLQKKGLFGVAGIVNLTCGYR